MNRKMLRLATFAEIKKHAFAFCFLHINMTPILQITLHFTTTYLPKRLYFWRNEKLTDFNFGGEIFLYGLDSDCEG
jgi:hypothetical protein